MYLRLLKKPWGYVQVFYSAENVLKSAPLLAQSARGRPLEWVILYRVPGTPSPFPPWLKKCEFFFQP